MAPILRSVFLLAALLCTSASAQQQQPLLKPALDKSDYYQFPKPIRRVAVIGAGASGLQAAAALLEEGLEVRLFERQNQPSGNWYYRDEVPIKASFPNKPLVNSSYTPDIPDKLPLVRFYEEGTDGISNSWRLREHENPSAIWSNLTTIAPPFIMTLPNTEYPATLPWRAPNRFVGRHVRQFATANSLSSNDEESSHIISYSTRVERLHKNPSSSTWELTLRKLEAIPYSAPGRLRAEWWTEEFDAVVIATGAFNSAFVPSGGQIRNLEEWARGYPGFIYHSREYRRPGEYAGKHVLIIGGGVSSWGISNDLIGSAASVSISIRNGTANPLARVVQTIIHPNVTRIPEITGFSAPPETATSHGHGAHDLRALRITLANGTEVSGYDRIIIATGFRKSDPFLADYHNSTIKGREEPETVVAPILTDGTHVRSLHWTGHYIADPTLAVARFIPWTLGRYAAKGFARTFSGRARLPSIERMWASYPGAGKELRDMHGFEEWYVRLFLTWLNEEAMEFGGRFVDGLPRHHYDFAYFGAAEWGTDKFIDIDKLLALEETPRAEWPARNGNGRDYTTTEQELFGGEGEGEGERYRASVGEETWMDWNLEW